VEEPAPDPSSRPCLLAQPDRALLLDRPAHGLTPNDFGSLEELRERLRGFHVRYAEIARPFEWTFTRAALDRVLARVAARESQLKLAA
jgi:hypothetical protein